MKFIKEDLEKLILVDKLSYRKIGKLYDVSDNYIKKIAKKLGIVLEVRNPKNVIQHNRKTNIRTCLNCEKQLNKQWNNKYCCKECFNEYSKKQNYKNFLENNDIFCTANYTPKNFKDRFLIEQDNKCAICECKDVWNNKRLVFILDHIDGDASNNKRENLRLVCPNCDSQLDTFKSKNKNSARRERYLKNYKN